MKDRACFERGLCSARGALVKPPPDAIAVLAALASWTDKTLRPALRPKRRLAAFFAAIVRLEGRQAHPFLELNRIARHRPLPPRLNLCSRRDGGDVRVIKSRVEPRAVNCAAVDRGRHPISGERGDELVSEACVASRVRDEDFEPSRVRM